jgi:D-alanine-D-alanine ligase
VDNRIRVGVIFGGKSGEHEVSIQSGQSIIKSLDPNKYDVVPIGITRRGQWLSGPQAFRVLQAEEQISLGTAELEFSESVSALPVASEYDTMVPPKLTDHLDVVIPVLHGPNGEDGTIQGVFELLDIPYVGAGVLASAVGMDKVFMKKLFASAGLPQADYTFYTRSLWQTSPEQVIADVEAKLGYPCFVKPVNMGSSVGVSKVKSRDDLRDAMNLAAKYDRKIIVEQGIDAREVEVGVLGNDTPAASVPGELVSSNEFYDYQAKYVSGQSQMIIPAPLSSDLVDEIQQLAVAAFQAVDCSGLARVDFFVEQKTNRLLVNEINTMPGFTRYSMYPKLWEATGVGYSKLLETLIDLAIQRHQDKIQSSQDYSAGHS